MCQLSAILYLLEYVPLFEYSGLSLKRHVGYKLLVVINRDPALLPAGILRSVLALFRWSPGVHTNESRLYYVNCIIFLSLKMNSYINSLVDSIRTIDT